MSDDFLKERRQSLEEEFFRRQNQQKLDAMKKDLQDASSRETLEKASGIDSPEVLDNLLKLGITGETVAALTLVPLIYVAWADGKIQDAERDAILRGAEAKGIQRSSAAWDVLSSWLEEQPSPALFDAWKQYIQALGNELFTADQFSKLETQVLSFARGVAESAGGFLGLGKVADAEDDAIARIEAIFRR